MDIRLSEKVKFGMRVNLSRLSQENAKFNFDELYQATTPTRAIFDNNGLVVQAKTLEGHRTYAAYHPPRFMEQLFVNKYELLEHLPGKIEKWGISQDKWILKALK